MKDELTAGEKIVLNAAIKKITGQWSASSEWWLRHFDNNRPLTPDLDKVCAALRQIQLQNRRADMTVFNDALRAQLKLGCRGGMSIKARNRFLITKAVDAVLDPGVPVALDFWLEQGNRDDLIDILSQYHDHDAPTSSHYALEKLMHRLTHMSADPPEQKTEHDRMRDFFFPKRRGSFFSLKSWK